MFGDSLYAACFSGHRADKFPFSLERENSGLTRLRGELSAAIRRAVRAGYVEFYCGGAWGFDILAGEEVMALARENQSISLICAVPFLGQERSFSAHWKKRYEALLESSSRVEVLSQNYSREAYLLRNRFMVDNTTLLICYYNGSGGGTGYTVRYAGQKGLEIVNLAE